jgi:hypothetical protein
MSGLKAITVDDVYFLYERNKRIYDHCTLANRKCPSLYEECYCYLNVPVLPITIGDQFSCCNFKIKTYINPQEECSICLEQISTKSNAYLTNCGHAFHKSCLFKSYEISFNQYRPLTSNLYNFFKFNCPLCRKHINYPDFYCRYPQWSVLREDKNYLDVLEEFWLSKDYTIGQLCYRSNNKHYLGMNNNCKYCLDYRILGK